MLTRGFLSLLHAFAVPAHNNVASTRNETTHAHSIVPSARGLLRPTRSNDALLLNIEPLLRAFESNVRKFFSSTRAFLVLLRSKEPLSCSKDALLRSKHHTQHCSVPSESKTCGAIGKRPLNTRYLCRPALRKHLSEIRLLGQVADPQRSILFVCLRASLLVIVRSKAKSQSVLAFIDL
jgi:hypothetical protein